MWPKLCWPCDLCTFWQLANNGVVKVGICIRLFRNQKLGIFRPLPTFQMRHKNWCYSDTQVIVKLWVIGMRGGYTGHSLRSWTTAAAFHLSELRSDSTVSFSILRQKESFEIHPTAVCFFQFWNCFVLSFGDLFALQTHILGREFAPLETRLIICFKPFENHDGCGRCIPRTDFQKGHGTRSSLCHRLRRFITARYRYNCP